MSALEIPYYPIIDVNCHPFHPQTSTQKETPPSFMEQLKEKYKEILAVLNGYYEETYGPIDNITEIVNYRTRYTKYFTMLEKHIEYPDRSSKKIVSLYDKNDTLLSISESIQRSNGSSSFVTADYDDKEHMYRKICINNYGNSSSEIAIYDSEGEISSYLEH